MKPTEVAFIMYPVTDLPRSIAFYQDVLGLQPNGHAPARWVEFDIAGVTFGLGDFPEVGKPGTANSLALEVEDLDAALAELKAKGLEPWGPYETPVCHMGGITDPDGNADRLFVFQRDVDKARQRLAKGDAPATN